jgi:hypothetical protein
MTRPETAGRNDPNQGAEAARGLPPIVVQRPGRQGWSRGERCHDREWLPDRRARPCSASRPGLPGLAGVLRMRAEVIPYRIFQGHITELLPAVSSKQAEEVMLVALSYSQVLKRINESRSEPAQ